MNISAFSFPASFAFSLRSRRLAGDAMIEALASTLVLSIVVIGVTQASKTMATQQRDTAIRTMYLQQAHNQIYVADENSACNQNLGALTAAGSNDTTALSLDCNNTITAIVNGKRVEDVAPPRTGTLQVRNIGEQFKAGLGAKEDQ